MIAKIHGKSTENTPDKGISQADVAIQMKTVIGVVPPAFVEYFL